MKLKLGIDDAGRGPVIGPMILAGCVIDAKDEEELRNLGVKDSKLLTQEQRVELEAKIKEVAKSFFVEVVSPDEIEEKHAAGINLNEVEAIYCAHIINKSLKENSPLEIVIDCPSVNTESWSSYVVEHIADLKGSSLACEHKADFNHISVACASILAKCERERQMEALRELYSDIGSGYPGDPKTKAFLEEHALAYKDEGIFRKTWGTYKNAVEHLSQKKLF